LIQVALHQTSPETRVLKEVSCIIPENARLFKKNEQFSSWKTTMSGGRGREQGSAFSQPYDIPGITGQNDGQRLSLHCPPRTLYGPNPVGMFGIVKGLKIGMAEDGMFPHRISGKTGKGEPGFRIFFAAAVNRENRKAFL
jgi:hypothetical protein